MELDKQRRRPICRMVNELCRMAPELTTFLPPDKSFGERVMGGLCYYVTQEFWELSCKLCELVVNALPENTVCDKDVDNLLWRTIDKNRTKRNLDCGTDFVDCLTKTNFKRGSFITDDHIVQLDGLDHYTIGSVTILRKEIALAELKSYVDNADKWEKDWLSSPATRPYFMDNENVEFAFKVRLNDCFADPELAALKLVNAFLTLYRIFRLSEPTVYAFDGVRRSGMVESLPFIDTTGNGKMRGFCLDDKSFYGAAWSMPVRYIISEKTLAETNGFAFQELGTKLLDYKNLDHNNLAFRVFVALQWMSRARQTQINAEKYLFNFNALETLLCGTKQSDGPDGISERISKNVEKMLANKPGTVAPVVKKLYGSRSKIVHSGDTKFSMQDVTNTQIMAENVMYVILTKYKEYLDEKHDKFLEQLETITL